MNRSGRLTASAFVFIAQSPVRQPARAPARGRIGWLRRRLSCRGGQQRAAPNFGASADGVARRSPGAQPALRKPDQTEPGAETLKLLLFSMNCRLT
jgi:hypothetical protein